MLAAGPVPFLFGGHCALDFTNTVNSRAVPATRDYLPDYAALADWCRQAGLLPETLVAGFREAARALPVDAREAFDAAISLREALFRIFKAVLDGARCGADDLEIVDHHAVEARRAQALRQAGGEFRLDWREAPPSLMLPVQAVAEAADELLRGGDLGRLGQCPPPEGCGWLFIDRTRNRSRRWCSMDHCGASAKARRFAKRHDGRIER